jgi:3-deoxy-manno-octulosonate cytidylyltransferase (CMP-KDO synthetase)
MAFTVLIPARYASTRLPGKPLADIAGKPMVVRVAERAQKRARPRESWWRRTTQWSAKPASAHGIAVCMTREDHPTGTDRLRGGRRALGLATTKIVVNVQGDEPASSIRANEPDGVLARRSSATSRDRHRVPPD